MELRKKVKAVIESGNNPFSVSKATGIPYTTVYEIFNGKTDIDRFGLSNAEKFGKYYDDFLKKQR